MGVVQGTGDMKGEKIASFIKKKKNFQCGKIEKSKTISTQYIR